MSNNIGLESDFKDFYDNLFNDKSSFKYKRNLSDSMPKGKALKTLKSFGTPTIEIKPVSQFNRYDSKLVVYTDPKLHLGMGKQVCSWHEAMLNYSNCLASLYLDETDGVSLKFLQLGSRRFRIMMKGEKDSLLPGVVTSIEELEQGYNYVIPIPIFSIDYISNGNEMVAIDYNEVQELSSLGIEKIITEAEVVEQIYRALIHYNLC